MAFTHMVRNDMFYIDQNGAKYSLVKLDGFLNFTENMQKRYPGYCLSAKGHIVPSTDETLNLDELLGFFRSKDLSRYEKEKAKFFGPSARYTTGNAVEQMKVLFATYPRSGNSMMRKYFENISGLVTGTDNDVNHPPVIAL